MANLPQLYQALQSDEGFKSCPYQDSKGFWTIGYGRMVDIRKGGGITPQEGLYLLQNSVMELLPKLAGLIKGWDQLNDVRQNVLANMAFQLGLNGLIKFTKMLSAIQIQDYNTATSEMLNSEWAVQAPNRANRLAGEMQRGIISSP